MHDVGLADRIRARGVKVIEIAGWQTRGSASFDPRGSVNHHTAGPASGVAPSLAICTYGRSDLSGPLCNVLQGRDDVAYVIAAGRANHAGKGGWKGLTGNSSVYGLEVEHTGYGAVSRRRHEVSIQIHAAFAEGPTMPGDAGLVCQHSEWAPGRKIDFRSLAPFTPDLFRVAVAEALQSPTPSPIPEDDDMVIIRHPKGPAVAVSGGTLMGIKSAETLANFERAGIPVVAVDDATWQDFHRVAKGR